MSRSEFWDFSCAVYESLREDLLFLQDNFGVNVNMVLCCAWAARCGIGLGKNEAESLASLANRYETRLIEPLRRARRHSKEIDLSLYESLKSVELRCEQICQIALQKHTENFTAADLSVAVLENLRSYLYSLGFAEIPILLSERIGGIAKTLENYER